MLIDRSKFDEARARIDRSQAWVARKAGFRSRQLLQHYLEGRPLPPDKYLRLSVVLGTTNLLRDDDTGEMAA